MIKTVKNRTKMPFCVTKLRTFLDLGEEVCYNKEKCDGRNEMSIDKIEQKLLSALSPDAVTTVKSLAGRLYVSESTARRYINALAERGLVIRTHGGCMPSSAALDRNTPMYIRFSSEQEDKKKIAERAATLIPPSATVFLDSSSTAFHLIPYLALRQDVTVITSGLKTAMALTESNVRTVILGGPVNSTNRSANSAAAMEMISHYNADLFFFSCDGLSEEGGLSDNSFEECLLRRAFMKYAEKSVLLIDPTKRGRKCKYNLCTLAELDACVTVEDGEAVFLDCASR